AASLCLTGQLSGVIRVPDTVGHLVVTADVRASRIDFHVDIDAPSEGRPTTRVNWLARQLKQAPETLRVEAFVTRGRGSSAAAPLATGRENPASLIAAPAREIRSFRVAMTAPMGAKRGRGRGSFIDSVLDGIDTFYTDVLQNLRAWSAAPPRLRPDQPRTEDLDE